MYRAKHVKTKIRVAFEQGNVLDMADKIIVHNNQMKNLLISKGIPSKKLVTLDIFDYLVDNDAYPANIKYGDKLIVAGVLRKKGRIFIQGS